MQVRLSISRFIPISTWLPGCSWKTARGGVVAGIAIAGLLMPEGMAYAGTAGVPPQVGLYAAMLGMFVYAIFGTSRQLAVTSTSSSAAMLAALVAPIAVGDSARYMVLVSAATIAAGAIFPLGGALRLGAVSEFISKPVLKGFVFGLALTIVVKQARKLMGIPGGKGNLFHQSWHVVTSSADVHPWTLGVGVTAIVVMLLLGALAPRVPNALVVLVLGILSVSWFGLEHRGVEVVGTIHAGVPSLTLPRIGEDDLADVLMGAVGIVLVLVAEALAAGRTFAAKNNYEIVPNQELFAFGLANLTSGLFGGMIVGGGMSGTAANDSAGARTQLSTITASLSVALTLAILLPLFRNLPEAVLGAIVVHAVAHLADVGTLKYYAKLKTGSFWVALAALFGVLQMGILKGLIFAVGLTLIALMLKLSSPQDSVLGRLPGSANFVDVARHPEAEQIPGVLIFQPNGVLFFTSANRVLGRLRELVRTARLPLRAVIINLEASPEIDCSMRAQVRLVLRAFQFLLPAYVLLGTLAVAQEEWQRPDGAGPHDFAPNSTLTDSLVVQMPAILQAEVKQEQEGTFNSRGRLANAQEEWQREDRARPHDFTSESTLTENLQVQAPASSQTPVSPKQEAASGRRGSLVVAPIPISSPALGTGLIPVLGYIFPLRKDDKVSPPSVLGVAGLVTDNGTRGFAAYADLFFGGDTYRITSLYVHGNLNYDLYGVGVAAGTAGRKFPLEQSGQGFRAEVLRRIGWDFFFGVRFWTGGSEVVPRLSGGTTPSGTPPPDLGINTTLRALGLRLKRETSPNRFYPTSGTLLDFTSDFFSDALGSKYSFQAYRFTFNKYGSLRKNQVIAYNLFLCGTGGDPPFYGNCVYGTNNELRGYTAGRYLDRYMFATQLEYRLSLPKRFGLVGFGGIGEVVPGGSQIFRSSSFLPAGGGGLRFKLSKKYGVNLRADIAQGKDTWTWSMGVGEAF